MTLLKMCRQNSKDLINYIPGFLLTGSRGLTSCPDTVAPTLEWNHTSASCVRRSLPAVITCRNTSKSIGFHEAAGQDDLQTDPPDPFWQTDVKQLGGVCVCVRVRGKTEDGGWKSKHPLKESVQDSLCLYVFMFKYVRVTYIHGTVIIY